MKGPKLAPITGSELGKFKCISEAAIGGKMLDGGIKSVLGD
jgi:hypothetical protein